MKPRPHAYIDPAPPLFGGLTSIPVAQHDNPVAQQAAAEVTASGRRDRDLDLVLAALRVKARTGRELLAITHRYSARIHDARRLGYRILTTPLGRGEFLFTLKGEPNG